MTLSVGIGAYVRTVYVACGEIYDKIVGGDLVKLWPLEAWYTKSRLSNLRFVQRCLRRATVLMFLFIVATSFRLLVYAALAVPNAIPIPEKLHSYVTDIALARVDFCLIAYLTVAFLFMWFTHWLGSKREIQYHRAMHADFRAKSAVPPQSN